MPCRKTASGALTRAWTTTWPSRSKRPSFSGSCNRSALIQPRRLSRSSIGKSRGSRSPATRQPFKSYWLPLQRNARKGWRRFTRALPPGTRPPETSAWRARLEIAAAIVFTAGALGYFVMVPRSAVRELDMSVDDALKYIISMGVVTPRRRHVPPGRGAHAAPGHHRRLHLHVLVEPW